MLNKFFKKKSSSKSALQKKTTDNENIIYTDEEFLAFYELCKPFTMTSIDRQYSLYSSIVYIIKNNIEGDFVECGVWKGGSSMMIALVLNKYNIRDRKIYMYDTYEGMSEPDDNDKDFKGLAAKKQLELSSKEQQDSVWCYSSLQEVKNNLASTKYNLDNINFIKGKVEDTIPGKIPDTAISLLRLDTDWHASTRHELEYLYPLLCRGGVLIIDDYGHWQGCRKAVDEYFLKNNINLLLNVIDYTGRVAIKY